MFRGYNQILVLSSLVNEDLAALDIIDSIDKSTGIKISVGGIYTTLERLEQAGLVAGSYRAIPCDNGVESRRRRYYRLTANGQRACDAIDLVKGVPAR